MKRVLAALAATLLPALPAPALAASDCGDYAGATVFHCSIKGSSRQVTVCEMGDGLLRYAYGKPGQEPEMELMLTPREVTYTPWPGIGRYIWSSLSFPNGEYAYEVSYSFDRNTAGAETEGTLVVMKGGDILATKECQPGTLEQYLDDLESLF